MKFAEAMKLMENGKKVTKSSWELNDFIHVEDGRILDDGYNDYKLTSGELESEEWEEWEEVKLDDLIDIMKRAIDFSHCTENAEEYTKVLRYLKNEKES